MAYNIIYQLTFKNKENTIVDIYLSDTLSGEGSPVITPLVCTGAQIKIVNDNDDKFSIIKGKRLEFGFLPSASATLTTFLGAEDDRWLVHVYVGGIQILSAFLVTDATKEAFQPIEGKYPILLTASDNLGLLKEIPLTKPDGTNPRGKFKLIEYLSWALKKTGHNLPINIAYNLKPEGFLLADATHDEVYLDAKTFEKGINTSEDCYTVIEKILDGCFITQENNVWWIVRVDEIDGTPYQYYLYDADGVLLGNATTSKSKNIGKIEDIKFIGKDAEVMPERPVKYVEETFKLNLPREMPDNSDFNRGTTWVSPYVVNMSLFIREYALLADFPTTGEFDLTYKATGSGIYYKWTGATYLPISGAEVPQGFAYELDDWTLQRSTGGSPVINAYVTKIKQFGNEIGRYLAFTPGAIQHWVVSSRIDVNRFDKLTFSVDRRFLTNLTGSGLTTEFIAQIRLFGEDGTYWTVTNVAFGSFPANSWVPTNSTFTNDPMYIQKRYVRNDEDETKWSSTGVDTNPIPVSGTIEILLLQHTTAEHHFANLQLELYMYINDSYQKYDAQINTVSHAINTKQKREDEVFIADSPHSSIKGTQFLKTAGGQYHKTKAWYNYLAGTSGELGIAPFGKYQAFERWNQHNRIIRKFQGSLIGMNTDTDPADIPGLLHNYTLTAVTDHTTDKKYMLLSYTQDLDTCKWSGVFAEVFDDNIGKLFNSDHEFKYTTSND
jgi:hypothetical protein